MATTHYDEENIREAQEEAFRLYSLGYTQSEIAAEVGRDASRISRWKHRFKWDDRKAAMDQGLADPGASEAALAVLDTPMSPEQVGDELALLLSRLIAKANESLETRDMSFKNVYHFKALLEALRLMQEMQYAAEGRASDIKETRHVHVIEGSLEDQIRWLEAMKEDGVTDDLVIEGNIIED